MNPNDYEMQQKRAWSRKLELIIKMGGECSKCGYKKNVAALEFHHIDPSQKKFPLDSRHLSNTSMDKILEESEKCILLCSNCHKEIHYPSQEMDALSSTVLTNKSLFSPKKKMSICPVCQKEFPYERGKIFCSKECREKAKGYPEREEVLKKYDELKSQQKVADFFGLTRKIIIGILKKEK